MNKPVMCEKRLPCRYSIPCLLSSGTIAAVNAYADICTLVPGGLTSSLVPLTSQHLVCLLPSENGSQSAEKKNAFDLNQTVFRRQASSKMMLAGTATQSMTLRKITLFQTESKKTPLSRMVFKRIPFIRMLPQGTILDLLMSRKPVFRRMRYKRVMLRERVRARALFLFT
jgi:hypothetical protein